MSTQSRYTCPADESEWAIPGAFDTVFAWEYENGREALLKLYEKGKNLQWNTNTRIDWSQDLDPENPQELPDESVSIFGSDVWNRLTRSEKANVRRHVQAKDIGLWGSKIRRAYSQMGIIGFADVDTAALERADEQIAAEFDAKRRAGDRARAGVRVRCALD